MNILVTVAGGRPLRERPPFARGRVAGSRAR
jgi:hypothetical protein